MHFSRTSVLAAPVVIGFLFAGSILGIERLAFRDVSHFYTPLYDYIADRASQQWLPLWNPLDQTGVPLVGESTTAFFYPLRILVYMMPMSAGSAMALYVAIHLVLAAASARHCARLAGASKLAANFSAAIYPLSGSVLFLYTNPPFLVGAAWLPLVLGPLLCTRMLTPSVRVLWPSLAMAMMVLGGDPQIALHAMLVVFGAWLIRCCKRQPETGRQLLVLLSVPVIAMVLSLPQVCASIDWSRQSDRVGKDVGVRFGPPRVDSRRHEAYQFSLPPWHAAELLTPNASGSLLPESRRISGLVPGDGRMWTPTIYMSVLVAAVMLVRFIRIRRDRVDLWLGIAAFGLLASFGHFGLVWLLQNTVGVLDGADSAVGGPYWFLNQFLPGYEAFRYPTKWLPFVALGGAVTTATWLDRGLRRDLRLFRSVNLVLLLSLSAAACLAAVFAMRTDGVLGRVSAVPYDRFWGPLDVAGGFREVALSLVQSSIAISLMLLVIRRFHGSAALRTLQLLLLGVVLLDLALSARRLVYRVPTQSEIALVDAIKVEPGSESSLWMRTQSQGGWPKDWRETRSDDRLADVEASVRGVWFGRWHLEQRQRVLNNMTSIQSRPMQWFWRQSAAVTRGRPQHEIDRYWHNVRRWLGVDRVLHTTDKSQRVDIDGKTRVLVDAKSHQVDIPEPVRVHLLWSNRELVGESGMGELLRRVGGGELLPNLPADAPKPIESDDESMGFEVTESRAESCVIEVGSARPMLVERTVFQDGNWIASYRTRGESEAWQPTEVFAVDYLKQGVVVPPGDWELRFRYEPKWVRWALPVCGIGWIAILVFAASVWRKKRGKVALA